MLETPAPGPAVQRASRPLLAVRGEVPLPEGRSGIAVLLEDLRERRGRFRDERVVAREAAGELADLTEAHGVVVAAGQQGGAGRRTQGGDMEPVVAQSGVCDPGEVRGVDVAAEGAGVAEAGVVDEHQQHVGRTLGRLDVPEDVPVGHRPLQRALLGALEHRIGHWELPAVQISHSVPSLLTCRRPPEAGCGIVSVPRSRRARKPHSQPVVRNTAIWTPVSPSHRGQDQNSDVWIPDFLRVPSILSVRTAMRITQVG